MDLTVKRYIKGDTYHSNYSVLERFEIAYHQKCVNQTKYISEKESKNTAHQEGMLSKEPVHLQKLNLILAFLDPGHKHTMVRLEEVVSYAISFFNVTIQLLIFCTEDTQQLSRCIIDGEPGCFI